jgi:hypothetical protein
MLCLKISWISFENFIFKPNAIATLNALPSGEFIVSSELSEIKKD